MERIMSKLSNIESKVDKLILEQKNISDKLNKVEANQETSDISIIPVNNFNIEHLIAKY